MPTSKGNSIFSLHASKKSGKLISHLLGLDHEQSTGAGANSHVIAFFKNIKVGDLFQGVKLTPNFMFFLLFLGFFLWIFVIYWVRHNEPLANQVLGTPKADLRKSMVDRQLVAGIKNAFPVQTSNSTGEIYVPGSTPAQAMPLPQRAIPTQMQAPLGGLAIQSAAPTTGYGTGYQVTNAAPIVASPVTTAAPAQFGMAGAATNAPGEGVDNYGQALVPVAPVAANPSAAAYPTGQSNYMVGVPSSAGPRLKTIVNR